jgi:hypothetical protein
MGVIEKEGKDASGMVEMRIKNNEQVGMSG